MRLVKARNHEPGKVCIDENPLKTNWFNVYILKNIWVILKHYTNTLLLSKKTLCVLYYTQFTLCQSMYIRIRLTITIINQALCNRADFGSMPNAYGTICWSYT